MYREEIQTSFLFVFIFYFPLNWIEYGGYTFDKFNESKRNRREKGNIV